jgi:putative transcriptional regulator
LPEHEECRQYEGDRKPGDTVATSTDWAAVAAMSDDEVHAAAVADPDALPLTDADFRRMTRLVNVKKLRERLGQTQEAFAATYRIPLGTLRDWEQRRKQPDAPARAYLTVIARDPAAIAALLREAA